MSKLQEKMSEKMFVLFGGISKSLSDIEYAIQQDAEYMKQGNPNNQAKNEMSRNRPENLDYTDVKNIKKPNGAKPGFVVYYTYYSVNVKPRNPSC